jgi:hypothetical protein
VSNPGEMPSLDALTLERMSMSASKDLMEVTISPGPSADVPVPPMSSTVVDVTIQSRGCLGDATGATAARFKPKNTQERRMSRQLQDEHLL